MLTARTPLAQRLVPRTGALARPLVRNGLLVLLGTMLMTLCARISLPLSFTPVPITLQTFAVLLIGALLGPRLGALTMVVYILEALAGLPVLANGLHAWSPSRLAGLPVIIGPTAGYLFSFVPAAALVGALAERGWDRQVRSAIPAMLLGNLVILLGGFAWLATATLLLSGTLNLTALFLAAVLPFLPGDALKLMLAALALPGGWKLLERMR